MKGLGFSKPPKRVGDKGVKRGSVYWRHCNLRWSSSVKCEWTAGHSQWGCGLKGCLDVSAGGSGSKGLWLGLTGWASVYKIAEPKWLGRVFWTFGWLWPNFFLQPSSCQNGSAVCNVIRCKFHMQEINVIKTVHISENRTRDCCFTTSMTFGRSPQCVWLILLQKYKALERRKNLIYRSWNDYLLYLQSSCAVYDDGGKFTT